MGMFSNPTRPPEPGVWCSCHVREDGGCVDEGNCIIILQLVWVHEPAVAPCCASLLGRKTLLRG